jgi:hypothetical protein
LLFFIANLLPRSPRMSSSNINCLATHCEYCWSLFLEKRFLCFY